MGMAVGLCNEWQWWRAKKVFAELFLMNFIEGLYEIGIRTATAATEQQLPELAAPDYICNTIWHGPPISFCLLIRGSAKTGRDG